jgi:hypothetical protein
MKKQINIDIYNKNKMKNNLDKLVGKILNEEINKKVDSIVETLYGGQKNLDVAEPKGRLTAADFKKIRQSRREEKDKISDILNRKKTNKFKKYMDEEMEEGKEVCSECGVGRMSEGMCNECGYSRMEEDMDEEMEEGNAFSGALNKAKEEGDDEFTVDGKTYPVREGKEKWIQKTKIHKGALHKKLGVPEGEKIPKSELNKLKKELESKGKGDKKLSASDLKLLKQVNLALNLKNLKEEKNSLTLTENELIDMIENIIMEQKKKKEEDVKVSKIVDKVKDTIGKKYVSGLAKTEKAHLEPSKKENDDYIKSVTKKMKEYLKDGSKGEYTESPKHFPKGNGELAKMDRVGFDMGKTDDEFVKNFSAAGLENITYDEIHPNEEWVSDNVEGSSRTGNNPDWANAVDTGINKERNQIRKDNLLGAVKQMAYNKAPQPVEDNGKSPSHQKFEKNFGKGAGAKANKILNKLESTEDKKEKLVSEEMNKMKNLINYSKKTQ